MKDMVKLLKQCKPESINNFLHYRISQISLEIAIFFAEITSDLRKLFDKVE